MESRGEETTVVLLVVPEQLSPRVASSALLAPFPHATQAPSATHATIAEVLKNAVIPTLCELRAAVQSSSKCTPTPNVPHTHTTKAISASGFVNKRQRAFPCKLAEIDS